MGWWLGLPVQRSDRSSRRHSPVGVSPSGAKPRVPVHVFDVEDAGHQDRQSPAETGGHVRSDQWAGRRKVAASIIIGLPARVTRIPVASKWVRPGTGTEWWTIPWRTRMVVPPPL